MDNDLDFMRLERNREVSGMEILPPGSRKVPEPVGVGASSSGRRFSWPWLAAWVIFALGLGWFGYAGGFSLTPPQALQAASVAPTMTKPALKTTRIADLKVGLRVLGQTPESLHEELPPLEINDPTQWRLFALEQRKEDGGTLRIELMRPVAGVDAAVLTEEDLLPRTSGLPLAAEVFGYLQPAVRIPARTIALGAELGLQFAHAPNLDQLMIGRTLELDLPEMGAVGEARIVGIAPCPEIEKGQGRVVTGRFIHQAANVVDLKITTSESDPIGTTDNHPFWSEDRQDYIPVGELKIGETLRTVNGSQTYVQSIRPRGPPEDVYNLEVEGAHTYHVGISGILVHNMCGDEVTLYRAVSEAEFQDLKATGVFRQGNNSSMGKWFADSLEGAKKHGDGLYKNTPYRIVAGRVSSAIRSASYRMPNLDGHGGATYIGPESLIDVIVDLLD